MLRSHFQSIVSVYCLYDDCLTNSTIQRGICEGVGNSKEVQGCVRPQNIVRNKVINVTDFGGVNVGDCAERCRELEGEGFALTRC